MTGSWLVSIFFFVSFIALFLSIFVIKKTDKEVNGIVWCVLNFIITIAVNAVMAGLLNLIRVPINILSIGIVDLIFSIVLWYLILKKKIYQKYIWKTHDIIIVLGILLVVVGSSLYRYGLKSLLPNFQAVDAPRHLIMAQDIINTQRINTGMFFADLYGALFIEMLSPLLANYKIFVISEIVNLFIAGAIFYAFISEICRSNKSYILAGIVSLLYLLGYPLHNALFGFVYWGMGVTLINAMLIMYREFARKDINRIIVCIYLMMLNFGLFTSYVLFIPPVFLAGFIYIVFVKYKEEKLFTLKTLIELSIIFLPAVIIGLLYTFSLVVNIGINNISESNSGGSNGGTTKSVPGISLEGGIYKDIYRDYIFLLPFALYEFIKELKKRKIKMNFVLFATMSVYMCVLFLGGMKGLVSSYYYCKNNYIMWLILFIAAFAGMIDVLEKNKEILYTYLFTWGMICVIFLSRVEIKIAECNENYDITKAGNYLNIYDYNKSGFFAHYFCEDYLELFNWMKNNVEKKGKKGALAVSTYYYEYWYQALVNRNFEVYNGDFDLYMKWCENTSDYVCVVYDDFYYSHRQHFDSLKRVYETPYGFVANIEK